MTSRPRRNLSRGRAGTRRYRRVFFIETEGSVSEPQYFEMLNNICAPVQVKTLKRLAGSAPQYLLAGMRRWLAHEGLRPTDQAWIVVDTDSWPEGRLVELHRWSTEDARYGLAVSNPKFEFWLLLHFEDGNGAATSAECSRRLGRRLPNYNKAIRTADFTPNAIAEAVNRAHTRDAAAVDWPRTPPGTTVHRLVAEIMKKV